MRRRAGLLLAAWPLTFCAGQAWAQPAPPGPFFQAVEDRRAGRADAAIRELLALTQTAPKAADVWLNLGLAYVEKNDLVAAEAALAQGLRISPDDPDLHIAFARLAYFRGRYAEARARLGPALTRAPSSDAQDLLKQIGAAEQAARTNNWRIDAVMTYSALSKGLAPWREWDLAAGHHLSPETSVSLGVEQTNRFGVSNTYLHGEFSQRVGGGGFFLGYGGSPNASYRARNLIQAGILTPPLNLNATWRLEGELDASWTRYVDGDVSSLQPQISLSAGDRLSLAARYIRTLDERRHALEGYLVRADAALAPRVHVNVAYAFAPDSSSGVTIQTTTVSLGLAVDLDDATTVRLGGASASQRTYTRQDFTVGLTRKF